MKLKELNSEDIAEIQGDVTDEFKEIQNEEISTHIQKIYDGAKPVNMPMVLILNKNKGMYLLHGSSI